MGNLESTQKALGEELVRFEAGDVLVIQCHRAGSGLQDTCDDVEQRGLARTVGSDQAGDGVSFNGQRGPVDGADAAEMHVQIRDRDHVRQSMDFRPPGGWTVLSAPSRRHKETARTMVPAVSGIIELCG